MKSFIILAFVLPIVLQAQVQYPKGTLAIHHITSPSLKNAAGENPTRRVTVYLPHGYEKTTSRYPVIYYLHGFSWSDSLQIALDHFDVLLDKAIATGIIRPTIVVLPNNHSLYRGSMYTNSTFTGRWADFNSKDLVDFVDKNYRTIQHREGRGIAGHSMGGYGAIKLAMLFPDVFSVSYGLSPGFGGLVKELGAGSYSYKSAQEIKTHSELISHHDFFANVVVALGRTITPNPDKPPFYADLPYTYDGKELIVHESVVRKWHEETLVGLADRYGNNLLKLKALKFDWGRNEEFPHIPTSCIMFSQKLESLGIPHYTEEYLGTHSNKLWTDDGRALEDMLPFFNKYLAFEEGKTRKAAQ